MLDLYSRTYSILAYIWYISPDITTRGCPEPGRRLTVTSRLVGLMEPRID